MCIVRYKCYKLPSVRKAYLHTLHLINVSLFFFFLISLFIPPLIFRVLAFPERTLQGHREPMSTFSLSWSIELLDFFLLTGRLFPTENQIIWPKLMYLTKIFPYVICYYSCIRGVLVKQDKQELQDCGRPVEIGQCIFLSVIINAQNLFVFLDLCPREAFSECWQSYMKPLKNHFLKNYCLPKDKRTSILLTSVNKRRLEGNDCLIFAVYLVSPKDELQPLMRVSACCLEDVPCFGRSSCPLSLVMAQPSQKTKGDPQTLLHQRGGLQRNKILHFHICRTHIRNHINKISIYFYHSGFSTLMSHGEE